MTDSPSGDGRLSASFARAARVPFLTTTFYLCAYASGSWQTDHKGIGIALLFKSIDLPLYGHVRRHASLAMHWLLLWRLSFAHVYTT